MPSTCLVLGGNGWTGRVLVPLLERRGVRVVAPRSAELDVTDADSVAAAVTRFAPDAIVNACAAQPGASEAALNAVNCVGAGHVARAAALHAARLVHVSTDVVLDGRTPPYDDGAPCNPLTPYGRSKAAGEEAVLASGADAVLVRTSLLWDPGAIDRATAGFAARLAAGQECVLYTDEIRCALSRHDLARALADLLALDVTGPLNVAGAEALSRLAFGTLLLDHFDVSGRERVRAERAAEREAAGAAPRPRDLTLVTDRAQRLLGRTFPGPRQLIASVGRSV